MKLTGKCKEDFEEWLGDTMYPHDKYRLKKFYVKAFAMNPDSMKYGVYVDFFDSVLLDIDAIFRDEEYIIYSQFQDKDNHRPEARQKAIEKANEIYNNEYKTGR